MTQIEEFEAKMKEYGYDGDYLRKFEYEGEIQYHYHKAQMYWKVWQACSQHYEARIKELEDALIAAKSHINMNALKQVYERDYFLIKQALTDKG